MSSAPQVLPFFHRDFRAAVAGWRLDEIGAYVMLLTTEWEQGPLPYEPDELQRIAGCFHEWPRVWARLEPKFPANDGRRRNARLEKVREENDEFRRQRQEAGRRGGLTAAERQRERRANR